MRVCGIHTLDIKGKRAPDGVQSPHNGGLGNMSPRRQGARECRISCVPKRRLLTAGHKLMIMLLSVIALILMGFLVGLQPQRFCLIWFIGAGSVALPYTVVNIWKWGYWKGRDDEYHLQQSRVHAEDLEGKRLWKAQ